MIFILFLFGLFIGSFLNVIIDRLPRGTYFSSKRSYCDNCKKQLRWYDLIPLLSFLILKGKCRYCKNKIDRRIPFVELVTGIGFVILFINITISNIPLLTFSLASFCILLAIFFIDLQHQIIPDILLGILIISTAIYHVVVAHTLLPYFITGVVSFILFFMLYLITKGKGMGFGDVKFAFVIGFMLGFPMTVVAFYGAFISGAILSLILIWAKKVKLKGTHIPFGPFLILGIFIALLFTETIVNMWF